MTTNGQFGLGKLSLISVFLSGISIFLSGNQTLAQITPDNTLGAESSVVTPGNIKGIESDNISGGAVRGSNLFHSFQEFNINEGKGAYFNNPTAIQNIFSRVTGGNPSNILGRLGVLGNANLFFMNPNGILFGKNASLDIKGSFLATTADSILFPNDNKFSTLNPEAAPLLTVNVQQPVGLEFEGKSGIITNRGFLAIGENLTLSAGDLDLQGKLGAGNNLKLQATNTITIRDSAAEPFIAAAGNQLILQGNQTIDIFALNNSHSGLFSGGDMVLKSTNPVSGDAHYWSGGSFRIEKLDGSLGELLSLNDPIIRSVGDVSFTNYFGTSLHILAGGSVKIPGTIIITGADTGTEGIDFIAEDITLSDGTIVSVDGRARPTLDVRAGVDPNELSSSSIIPDNNFPNEFFFPNSILSDLSSLLLFGFPLPTETSPTSADINVGTIIFADVTISDLVFGGVSQNDLLAGQVLLTNQYQPNELLDGNIEVSATLGSLIPALDNIAILTGSKAGGGSVYIDSRGSITLHGIVGSLAIPDFDNIFSVNGGEIKFLTNNDLTLKPGSAIVSLGALGGNIALKGNGIFSLVDSLVGTLTIDGNEGQKGGSLIVDEFNTIELLNGNRLISAELLGLFELLGISSTTESRELFNLFPDNDFGLGTILVTVTSGMGDAGNLSINTSNLGKIIINNEGKARGDVVIASTTSGRGDAGNLSINTSNLGKIIITSRDEATGNVGIASVTSGIGDAGDLTIDTGQLEISTMSRRQNSDERNDNLRFGITTLALGGSSGDGGDLRVDAFKSIEVTGNEPGQFILGSDENRKAAEIILELVTIPTGLTAATSGEGNAGNLTVNTGRLTMSNGVGISAGTTAQIDAGQGGQLEINVDSVELQGKAIISNTTLGAGDVKELIINADKITLRDGSLIASDTAGSGDAGKLTIKGRNNEATKLDIFSGSRVGASTLNQELGLAISDRGSGAEVVIIADSVNIDGTSNDGTASSGIFANSQSNPDLSTGEGEAGSITIEANTLKVTNGGQLITNTSGENQAGNITLKVKDSIFLSGDNSGLFANTEENSIGNGGSVFINHNNSQAIYDEAKIVIQDGAEIAVDSQGSGIGGNITLQAGLLTLDAGKITAETSSNQGGDITLTLADKLRLRNNSQITTTAGTAEAGGNGGNIIIDTPFIIAFPREDSDITANAFKGDGGKIQIDTQGIFGIEFRNQETPLSDITASSQFGQQGIVEINTSAVDPTRSLNSLPQQATETEVAQSCQATNSETTLEFFDIGRGGLPPTPEDLFSNDVIIAEWIPLDIETEIELSSNNSEYEISSMAFVKSFSCQ